MAAPDKSMGTKLYKTTDTLTLIAGLTSIGEAGVESTEIDTTTLDSTGGYKEFILGLKDSGEMALSGFVKSKSQHEMMTELADAQTLESWTVELIGGDKMFFEAYVKTWKLAEITVDGAIGFTGALRISGKIVYADTGISA